MADLELGRTEFTESRLQSNLNYLELKAEVTSLKGQVAHLRRELSEANDRIHELENAQERLLEDSI